mmetsp:Transcript_3786/g.8163  ORF Transcript_3786/g.8163 Transcript_3786/m.8163 type:complete len:164 (+) Transcript_3786:151-642(+)
MMANESGSAGYKYGSVGDNEELGANDDNSKNFDESHLYYYKEKDLTTTEKISKLIKLFVPIIIAVVLIGGLAYILFHDFGTLYPRPGGEKVTSKGGMVSQSTSVSSGESAPTVIRSESSPTVSKSKTSSSFGGSCAANPSCAALGLSGVCCPTPEGVQLGCCS